MITETQYRVIQGLIFIALGLFTVVYAILQNHGWVALLGIVIGSWIFWDGLRDLVKKESPSADNREEE